MAKTHPPAKGKKYEDIDLDALLHSLSPEDLEQLEREFMDPDDPHIPASDRCAYKCAKEPTAQFDRKLLMDFLETKAKEEKDWDEAKAYIKEKRGKVWKKKESPKSQLHEDEKIETEWDEILANASEEELVELAALLGFHGMLNQVQYHQAHNEGTTEKSDGGFQGVAKPQTFKLYQEEPPNDTDVEAALNKLKKNDKSLVELNINNIKNISLERLCEFAEILKSNNVLQKLHMSNTRATDRVAKAFAEALTANKALRLLNVESNYITGDGIIALLEAINVNQTLTEFRIANQRPQVLGHKTETRIAELVRENKTIVKFGIFLESAGARVLVQEHIEQNIDRGRKVRMGLEDNYDKGDVLRK